MGTVAGCAAFVAASAAAQLLPPAPESSQSVTAQSPSTLPELAPAPRLAPLPPPSLPPRPVSVPAPLVSSDPAAPVVVATPPALLSLPDPDPLRIDMSRDPILRLARNQSAREPFRRAVAAAVASHPQTIESVALGEEAQAVVDEARARGSPSVDLTLSSYRVIAREFSRDPENIIERSRSNQRTDALVAVNYTLFDFGATRARIDAAGARLRAAAAETDEGADRIALAAVAAWYDVFAYRALVAVSAAFIEDQVDLRRDVEDRVRQGVSAEGDVAQVDSFIAAARTRVAEFRRVLANAESRYAELIGTPAPANLARAPVPAEALGTREDATQAATTTPAARAAQAVADASRDEAFAADSDRYPQIGVGLDAGRYGVFETSRDFDVRGRFTLRQRFFGGIDARSRQVAARARAADARAIRVRDEASRDASIAWSDIVALEQQLQSLEANYIASRQTRDVLVERFTNSRGTLFDVASVQNAYFQTAAAYIRVLSELDAARYVLLSRTGRLLPALGIDTSGYAGGNADALRATGRGSVMQEDRP